MGHDILVTGATGFIGSALRPALLAAGHRVRATTRQLDPEMHPRPHEEWVEVDLLDKKGLPEAMRGMDAAYYLVHSMGGRSRHFEEKERRAAEAFAWAAAKAGIKRIIYLGGVQPMERASRHLRSRATVGEVLRSGPVPTIELRASMIVGNGSASWQIVRDLALRLPAMVMPAWTERRTSPIALQDVLTALVAALDVPLKHSEWFDLPGPDVMTARQILETVAALRGRRIPSVRVPVLTPRLSAWWLRFVTRADYGLARELVAGLSQDLLPEDDRYWELIGKHPQWTFERAARFCLATEEIAPRIPDIAGAAEEFIVDLVGPRLEQP